ncbi:MAG: hypothetical protein C0473_03635 [Cyanobacteria bacterium DS3.002]|nr:hypothetical protein [Cyanobacteria bacterium DS3.002]MBA4049799.1 hypothetical protein [Cyanobacteria bacterium DS2.008]MBA4076379.1 hypothetical protein [Cyanobacteria bacterium PR.023]
MQVTLTVRFHRTQFDKFLRAGFEAAAIYQQLQNQHKGRWRKAFSGTPYSKPLKVAWLTMVEWQFSAL